MTETSAATTEQAAPLPTSNELTLLANNVNSREREINRLKNDMLEFAFEQGNDLLKIKAGIEHGKFGDWIKENIVVGVDQANKYMRLAKDSDRLLELKQTKEAENQALTLDEADRWLRAERNKDKPAKPPKPRKAAKQAKEDLSNNLDDNFSDLDEPPLDVGTDSGGMPTKTVGAGQHSDSQDDEWHTPPDLVNEIRQVLGSINVDPCSNEAAQKTIIANDYYTKDNSSLGDDIAWKGTVFMNPPYSRVIKDFVNKFAAEFENGNIQKAITLTNAGTDTKWFKTLEALCTAMVFTPRIAFTKDDGMPVSNNTKGQVLMYFGKYPGKFEKKFKKFGHVWIKPK